MTSLRRLLIATSVLALAACGTGSKTVANTATPEVSAVTSQAADPNLVTDDDSGVDCTELGLDGYAMVMQQSSMTIDDQVFQIAAVSCMSDAGEGSAEVIESFIKDPESAVWASNGIASGPDVAFRTTGECTSDGSQVQCPANVSSEDGSDVAGMVVVTSDSGQPVWTFEPAS